MKTEPWWRGAVIYEIYPRSFRDSNRDGIGDLPGIVERLDHLRGGQRSLGVDAIWVSPFFPSPQADYGYDISDYTDVDPAYGTLADADRLIAAAHDRGLRVILDLVVSHTSVEHPWFAESRSSRRAARRDWYLWADPAPDSGPPNNWVGIFGGSAWAFDAPSAQYYLHSFYPEQPDLNWRNPAVADAMAGVMRFWLARGIDGFRVDAVPNAMKDPLLRDNPPAGIEHPFFGRDLTGQERLWNVDRPEVLEVVRHLRRVADERPGTLLLGEAYLPAERLAAYLGGGHDDGFELAFDFELTYAPWDADRFRLAIERGIAHAPAGSGPTWVLSNHDLVRHATRYGRHRAALAALILLTLEGTIVLYAGEEIGMVNGPSGEGRDRAGRDGARAPMQWDARPGAGFTEGDPWLHPVDPAHTSVAAQDGDPGSLLLLYRRLIALRAGSTALREGPLRMIHDVPPGVLAWTRETADETVLVAANMSDEPRSIPLGRVARAASRLAGTHPGAEVVTLEPLALRPHEGIVARPVVL